MLFAIFLVPFTVAAFTGFGNAGVILGIVACVVSILVEAG